MTTQTGRGVCSSCAADDHDGCGGCYCSDHSPVHHPPTTQTGRDQSPEPGAIELKLRGQHVFGGHGRCFVCTNEYFPCPTIRLCDELADERQRVKNMREMHQDEMADARAALATARGRLDNLHIKYQGAVGAAAVAGTRAERAEAERDARPTEDEWSQSEENYLAERNLRLAAEAEVERLSQVCGEHDGLITPFDAAKEGFRFFRERAEALEAEKADLVAERDRYRQTYKQAAQAHHEWAADPIYGCEHCARVTAALRKVHKMMWLDGYPAFEVYNNRALEQEVAAALASIPQGDPGGAVKTHECNSPHCPTGGLGASTEEGAALAEGGNE